MQINELYKLLGITKENLRYYEKEGLVSPQRKANGYRDYSEADAEQLKKVLLLRKIGVPVEDIRDVLENRKELNEVLSETAEHLDQHITLLEGIILGLRNIFEYDPQRVWKDPMYRDGRFDTYRYLTLTDRKTGADVTAGFIEKYMEANKNEEWETLLAAMETVKESWQSVYVDPEAAHMEGSN